MSTEQVDKAKNMVKTLTSLLEDRDHAQKLEDSLFLVEQTSSVIVSTNELLHFLSSEEPKDSAGIESLLINKVSPLLEEYLIILKKTNKLLS